MNLIGRTNDNGVVIVLNDNEARDFLSLRDALEGERLITLMGDKDVGALNYDFAGIFGAIRAFAMTRFAVNELKSVVDKLEQSVMKVSQPDLSMICEGKDGIWTLFHQIWGMAQDSENYDKSVLCKLEDKILALQAGARK